jgi:hypothetical protein
MKKLKLQLDHLRVDSFGTTTPEKAEGTVFGEQCTCDDTVCTCDIALCGPSLNKPWLC